MKLVKKEQTNEFQNNEVCTAIEYPMDDEDINGAVIKLDGRYPSKGRAMNKVCKEMAYVIKGSGQVIIEGEEIGLKQGDLVLIDPGEKFYWDGNMEIFMPCTPAWTPDQHEEVD